MISTLINLQRKAILSIVAFFFLFFVIGAHQSQVYAQACAPSIRIDVSGCSWDSFTNQCVHFFVPGTVLPCNTTTCRTISNVCSSNDPCVGDSALNCGITGCSPGYCSIAATPTPPPGATPGPPSGSCDGCMDAGSCALRGGSYGGNGSGGCNAAIGGYCSGTTTCGGGGGGGGTPPPGNLSCGQPCTSSAQCRNPSAAGFGTTCRNGICENAFCTPGNTLPGANCSCLDATRKCGETCGSTGFCGPGQGFCTHINPPGHWYDNLPDCYDNNTYCAGSQNGYSQPNCVHTDTGNSYLLRNSDSNWKTLTATDVSRSCAVCGDGIVGTGEQCDQGALNGIANSGCTTNCQSVSCNKACTTSGDCGSVQRVVRMTLRGGTGDFVVDYIRDNGVIYEGAPAIVTGGATWQVNTDSAPSGGGYLYATAGGATITYRTYSPTITLRTFRSSARGIVDVYVDGVLTQTLNTLTAAPLGWQDIAINVGPAQLYTCTASQCRLTANPSSATCATAACTLPVPDDPPAGVCADSPSTPELTSWTWPAIAGATSYNFRIVDNRTPTPNVIVNNSVWTAAMLGCASGGMCTAQVALLPTAVGQTYHSIVSVAGTTGACSAAPLPGGERPSPDFTLPVCNSDVTSTIQNDTQNGAVLTGGVCAVSSGATQYTAQGTVTASRLPSPGPVYTGAVNATGTYTITGVPSGNYNLTFTPPAGYFVTCPAGGTYPNVPIPAIPARPFFVSSVAEQWFQTVGGDLAALAPSGSVAVDNPIPVTFCAGTGCSPYFSLPSITGRTDTVGSLLVNAGSLIDVDKAPSGQSGNVGSPARVIYTTNPPAFIEGYDYFYRLFSMGVTPTTDLGQAGNNATDARLPNPPPANGNAYFVNGDLTIDSQNWDLNGNRKKVVFVSRDLHIRNEITVANGSFLGFIVKGNIIIYPNVGTPTFTQTSGGQVEGMYVADGTITVQSTGAVGVERKFIGEGTFAARGGIRLLRDFRSGAIPPDNGPQNNSGPASLFIYRPDLLINAPDQIKSPTYTWREVNP